MQEPNAPVDESQATATLQITLRSRDLPAMQRALDRITEVATDPAVFADDPRDATIDDWTRDVLDVVTEGTVEVHCTFTQAPPAADVPIPWRRARTPPQVKPPIDDAAPMTPTAPATITPEGPPATGGPRVFFDVPALAPGPIDRVDPDEAGAPATRLEAVEDPAARRQPPRPVEIVVASEAGDQTFVSEAARSRRTDVDAEEPTDRRRLAMRGALGVTAVAIVILLAWLWPTTPSVADAVDADITEASAEAPAIQTGAAVTPLASGASPTPVVSDEAPSPPAVAQDPAADEAATPPPPPPGAAQPAPAEPSAAAAPRERTPREPVAATNVVSEIPQAFVGALEITSSPTGAMVAVNNRAVGRTPLVLEDFPAGTHAVRIELAGFERWSKAIQVGTGQRASVDAVLRVSR